MEHSNLSLFQTLYGRNNVSGMLIKLKTPLHPYSQYKGGVKLYHNKSPLYCTTMLPHNKMKTQLTECFDQGHTIYALSLTGVEYARTHQNTRYNLSINPLVELKALSDNYDVLHPIVIGITSQGGEIELDIYKDSQIVCMTCKRRRLFTARRNKKKAHSKPTRGFQGEPLSKEDVDVIDIALSKLEDESYL